MHGLGQDSMQDVEEKAVHKQANCAQMPFGCAKNLVGYVLKGFDMAMGCFGSRTLYLANLQKNLEIH